MNHLDTQLAQLRRTYRGRFTVDTGDRESRITLTVELRARGKEEVEALLEKLLQGGPAAA